MSACQFVNSQHLFHSLVLLDFVPRGNMFSNQIVILKVTMTLTHVFQHQSINLHSRRFAPGTRGIVSFVLWQENGPFVVFWHAMHVLTNDKSNCAKKHETSEHVCWNHCDLQSKRTDNMSIFFRCVLTQINTLWVLWLTHSGAWMQWKWHFCVLTSKKQL